MSLINEFTQFKSQASKGSRRLVADSRQALCIRPQVVQEHPRLVGRLYFRGRWASSFTPCWGL